MELPDGDAAAAARRAGLRQALAAERKAGAPSYLFGEPRLQRFLQGNGDSVREAAEHFRRMLQWRREAEMDEHRKILPSAKEWGPDIVPGLSHMMQMFATDLKGYTLDGDLLWFQCDGLANFDKVLEMPAEEMYKIVFLTQEARNDHLDFLSEQTGQLRQVVQVRDLYGMRVASLLSNHRVLKRMRHVTKAGNIAFPESLRKLVLINLPAGFGLLWNVLKPLMNDRIKSKFVFITSADPIAELAQEVGTRGLEALVRARRVARGISAEATALEVNAGASEYTCLRLVGGEAAHWGFLVPDADREGGWTFAVHFYPDDDVSERVIVVAPEVGRSALARGVATGRFEAASPGLLWLTWSFAGGWSSRGSRHVTDLRLARGEDLAEPMATRRAVGKASAGSAAAGARRRRPSARDGCLGCFASPVCLPGARAPVEEDLDREGLEAQGDELPLKEVPSRPWPPASMQKRTWLPSSTLFFSVAFAALSIRFCLVVAQEAAQL